MIPVRNRPECDISGPVSTQPNTIQKNSHCKALCKALYLSHSLNKMKDGCQPKVYGKVNPQSPHMLRKFIVADEKQWLGDEKCEFPLSYLSGCMEAFFKNGSCHGQSELLSLLACWLSAGQRRMFARPNTRRGSGI